MNSMQVVFPYTTEEAEKMDVDDLLKNYRYMVEQAAMQEVMLDDNTGVAHENVKIFEEVLLNRLHAGTRAQESLQSYQERA